MNQAYLPPEHDDILEQCLGLILSGQQTVEDCLARFPEIAADLKPALQVARFAAYLETPRMEAAPVEALEIRLRVQMESPRQPRNLIFFQRMMPISRLAAGIIIVFLVAFGTGAGTVAASANSMPGDPLYGVKRLWEAIILALSPLTGQTDDLWLHFANARFDEVVALAEQDRLTAAALEDLYQAMLNAITFADRETATAVITFLDRAGPVLEEQIVPFPASQGDHRKILGLLSPAVRPDGGLELPESSLLLPVPTPETATPTLTWTSSPEPTETVTSTVTATATPTPTNTRRPTRTPRFPPTATNTPTLTPSDTPTVTPSPTPSATWTPLPLPTARPTTAGQPRPTSSTGSGGGPNPTATLSFSELSTEFVRQTQQAVYLTQTAGPPETEEPTP